MEINVLEARNNFSELIKRIEDNPDSVITICRRNTPVADLVAHRSRDLGSLSAAGSLSKYARPELVNVESGAFAAAMEAKHASRS